MEGSPLEKILIYSLALNQDLKHIINNPLFYLTLELVCPDSPDEGETFSLEKKKITFP